LIPSVGDQRGGVQVEYVGKDTVEGSTYGVVESYLGGYKTTMTLLGIDP
jgi:hypothetical protein